MNGGLKVLLDFIRPAASLKDGFVVKTFALHTKEPDSRVGGNHKPSFRMSQEGTPSDVPDPE